MLLGSSETIFYTMSGYLGAAGVKKLPGARGVYLTADGAQVTEITRGGYTGQIEELLIGTLYSQYARRHTTLSGRLLAGSQAGCDRGAMGTSAASSPASTQARSQVGGLCV